MNLQNLIFFVLSALAVSCTSMAKNPTSSPMPVDEADTPASTAKHDALWNIMNACVKGYRSSGSPAPCLAVDIANGRAPGHVILKDMKGASHFLVIPTQKITGIEDPILASSATTNYWQVAFENLSYVEGALGKKLPLGALAIGVNSVYSRSQEQLHLHMDCVAPDVDSWLSKSSRSGEVVFRGEKYTAYRIEAPSNQFINPFLWLHEKLGPNADLRKHALVLVTRQLASGNNEFTIFDADSGIRGGGSADLLMDRYCKLAH